MWAYAISVAYAKIDCHYCGIKELCTLPYSEKNPARVNCEKSCMKFDGYSLVDNKRVLVRDCGEKDINLCSKNSTWFGATGQNHGSQNWVIKVPSVGWKKNYPYLFNIHRLRLSSYCF